MSSALTSPVNSTLSSMPPPTAAGASLHTLWMSADVVWTLFLVLLALSMLVSLRFDWLRVWWLDQLRHLSGAQAAEDALSRGLSPPQSSQQSSRQSSRQPALHPASPPLKTTLPMKASHASHVLHTAHISHSAHPAPADQARKRTAQARRLRHAAPVLSAAGGAPRPLFHRSGRRH